MILSQVEFENELINKLTTGDSVGLERLKQHFNNAKLKSREMTGVGMYLNFDITPGSVERFKKDVQFGDLYITGSGFEYGAGVIVFINNGYLDVLECYVHGDEWPSFYQDICITYEKEPRFLAELDSAV